MKFKQLQALWYQKLKESGFEDIEDTARNTLKQFSHARTNPKSLNTGHDEIDVFGGGRLNDRYASEQVRQACNTHYYEMARAVMHSEKFILATERSPHHRQVWEKHAEGWTHKRIAVALGMSRQGVKWIVYKYRPLMKEVKKDDDESDSDT